MLSFRNADFTYEPYPYALLTSVFEKEVYDELIATWPAPEACRYVGGPGQKLNKYSLDEDYQPQHRQQFERNPAWSSLYHYIKSEKFLRETLRLLRRNGVDLGFDKLLSKTGNSWLAPRINRVRRLAGKDPRLTAGFNTRIQISTLPAQNGSVMPHSDNFDRVATLVIYLPKEGEWDPDWGGGLDINRPKDPSRGFNVINRLGVFEDMDVVRTIPYRPNEAFLVVKTFNSWHSVRPIRCPHPDVMRRSITISLNRPTVPAA